MTLCCGQLWQVPTRRLQLSLHRLGWATFGTPSLPNEPATISSATFPCLGNVGQTPLHAPRKAFKVLSKIKREKTVQSYTSRVGWALFTHTGVLMPAASLLTKPWASPITEPKHC